MPTAPSFKDFKRLSEPFCKGGKMYIKVEHPSTHNERDVRWYNDIEYAKNYGRHEKQVDGLDNLKKVRGFEKGPILVVRGVRGPADEEYLKKSIARYAMGIGWHFISTDNLPTDAPKHFKYILLSWNEAKLGDDRHIKNPKDLATIINAKVRDNKTFDITGSTIYRV